MVPSTSFQGLPPEIRVRIFQYALGTSAGGPVKYMPALLKALQPSYTLYSEAVHVWYEEHVSNKTQGLHFSFSKYAFSFAQYHTVSHVSQARRVILNA